MLCCSIDRNNLAELNLITAKYRLVTNQWDEDIEKLLKYCRDISTDISGQIHIYNDEYIIALKEPRLNASDIGVSKNNLEKDNNSETSKKSSKSNTSISASYYATKLDMQSYLERNMELIPSDLTYLLNYSLQNENITEGIIDQLANDYSLIRTTLCKLFVSEKVAPEISCIQPILKAFIRHVITTCNMIKLHVQHANDLPINTTIHIDDVRTQSIKGYCDGIVKIKGNDILSKELNVKAVLEMKHFLKNSAQDIIKFKAQLYIYLLGIFEKRKVAINSCKTGNIMELLENIRIVEPTTSGKKTVAIPE